jgi:hypothetical protein
VVFVLLAVSRRPPVLILGGHSVSLMSLLIAVLDSDWVYEVEGILYFWVLLMYRLSAMFTPEKVIIAK